MQHTAKSARLSFIPVTNTKQHLTQSHIAFANWQYKYRVLPLQPWHLSELCKSLHSLGLCFVIVLPQNMKQSCMLAPCRGMISTEEGKQFFQQLLQGLLPSLQPLQAAEDHQVHSSPLREPAKELLAATCHLLGPQGFLQQVLNSVGSLGNQSAALDPKQLEVGCMLCKLL